MFKRLGIAACIIAWCAYLFGPHTFPPRTLTGIDYFFMALVPLGAALCSRANTSWRWFLYLGIIGSMPFVLKLYSKKESLYSIQSQFKEPDLTLIYGPCLLLWIVLIILTVSGGLLGRYWKREC